MKNVLQSLAKSVLIPLGLTALASAVDSGIHKNILGSGTTILIISNEEMEDIMKRHYASFKDNIWGANLADMQLVSKFNEGIRFLLCIIDIFSKYAWVGPLKDKKELQLPMLFKR